MKHLPLLVLLMAALTVGATPSRSSAQAPPARPPSVARFDADTDPALLLARRLAPAATPLRRHVLLGAGVGAVAGGVGFATLNFALTTSRPRTEYTIPSLVLGAAGGAVVGGVVGAIVHAIGR